MKKPPRPSVVEKISAKQAQPPINVRDIANVVFAARQALPMMRGADFVNVADSIAKLEKSLQAIAAAEQEEAKAQTPATPDDAARIAAAAQA